MADSDLSEYEQTRLKNIERNNAMLRALGLDRSDMAAHQALNASTSNPASPASSPARRSKKRKAQSSTPEGVSTPVRQSRRLQGAKTSCTRSGGTRSAPSESGTQSRGRRDDRKRDQRHEAAAADHLRWAGQQERGSFVGTASYSHTLHRVRSMSEKALGNRVKAIERACGKYAVVKMQLFARVLLLEGYEDLAEEATAAYKRLRRKLGPVPRDQKPTRTPELVSA